MATTLLCLALAVFSEARGEPVLGQEAVAHVVLNRAEIRDMHVCEVLLEDKQFPWSPERYIRKVRAKSGGVGYMVRAEALPIARKGWGKAMATAQKALRRTNTMLDIEFFHSIHLKFDWNRRYLRRFVVGNHAFYSRKPEVITQN